MSRLEELIQQLCPDGVEWKKLNDVGDFFGGLTGKSKNDFIDGNAVFITYSNIYANPALNINIDEKVKINEGEKQNIVQYGDILFTGSSETPEECGMSSVVTKKPSENMYLNSFCFGLRPFDLNKYNLDYLKHVLRCEAIRKEICKTANGVTRYNVSKKKLGEIAIPLPPLPVQEEIVRILDTFTESTNNLKEQIQTRRKQYEYYRDQLLDLDGKEGVEMKTLGDMCVLGTGSHNTQDGLSEGQYPFYTRGSEILYLNNFDYDETAIITAGDGAGVGKVFHYVQGKYALHQRAYRIVRDEKKVLARFVYYYIEATFYNYIMRNSVSSSVVSIRRPMMVNYPVPRPPLAEQQRIVDILDQFEASMANLEAQLKQRQKQYEYYRNQLLDFKRKEV